MFSNVFQDLWSYLTSQKVFRFASMFKISSKFSVNSLKSIFFILQILSVERITSLMPLFILFKRRQNGIEMFGAFGKSKTSEIVKIDSL